jgi:type II secretory pathway pseudopilin PulG
MNHRNTSASIHDRPRAFTAVELAVVIIVLAAVMLLLPAMMRQQWNASGLDGSLRNVKILLDATAQYRFANAERVPMRGCGYGLGHITGGWDTWNFAGKNCSQFWVGGAFDESAYSRFLNSYLPHANIPVPSGYTNTGSGSTWNFNDGTPTAADRVSFQMKVCKSPGDVTTRQRNWPLATPGVSCYDDVGTSYLLNMKWWDQPGASDFTLHYNNGTDKIRLIGFNDQARPFAWLNDQTADIVANNSSAFTMQGEFGGVNMSVLGFLTGDASYLQITPAAGTGAEYTFYLKQ